MKIPLPHRRLTLAPILGLCACFSLSSLSAQTNGVYDTPNNPSPNWDTPAHWLNGDIPSGAGAIATIAIPQTGGTRTFSFSTDRTIGFLDITYNRETSGSLNYIFGPGEASAVSLTLDGGAAGNAAISTTLGDNVTGHSTTINIPVLLGSSLEIENSTTGSLTFSTFSSISAATAGTKTIINQGSIESSSANVVINANISDGAGVVAVRQDSATSWLTLGGTNSYTGGTIINAGRVTIASDANLGHYSSVVTLNGGTLRNTGTLNITGSNQRFYVLGENGGTFSTGAFLHVRGGISGDGPLIKEGTSTLAFYAETNNTYTGGTIINAGTVRINADSNLGASGTSVTLNGGTLQMQTGINVSSSQRPLIINSTSTLQTDGFTNWYGVVSGEGTLIKTGNSTLSLNNVNSTHTGGIQVEAGSFRVRNGDGGFGGAGNSVTFADGTSFLMLDSFTAGAGRTLTLTSGNVNFNLTGSTTKFTWEGIIDGDASLTLNKTVAEANVIFTLAGTASYAGDTILNGGTFRLGGDDRFTGESNLVLNGGIFDANGYSETFGTLSLTIDSLILLGDTGTNTLAFADSSALDWGSFTLSITGAFVSGQSIRFGLDANGLTSDQLSAITINGLGVGINELGYLTTVVPEPGTWALLGLGAGLLAFGRRFRRS